MNKAGMEIVDLVKYRMVVSRGWWEKSLFCIVKTVVMMNRCDWKGRSLGSYRCYYLKCCCGCISKKKSLLCFCKLTSSVCRWILKIFHWSCTVIGRRSWRAWWSLLWRVVVDILWVVECLVVGWSCEGIAIGRWSWNCCFHSVIRVGLVD